MKPTFQQPAEQDCCWNRQRHSPALAYHLVGQSVFSNFVLEDLKRQHQIYPQLATKLFISNITNVWSIKSIPIFRPKWLINHTPWGQQYLCSLYEGVTPLRGLVWTLENLSHFFHWAKFCQERPLHSSTQELCIWLFSYHPSNSNHKQSLSW